jgi:hypothetical protein
MTARRSTARNHHQRETLDREILERVIAGMVDCGDDEAVRRECRAEPRQ